MVEKARIYDDIFVTPISDGATISSGETVMRVVHPTGIRPDMCRSSFPAVKY